MLKKEKPNDEEEVLSLIDGDLARAIKKRDFAAVEKAFNDRQKNLSAQDKDGLSGLMMQAASSIDLDDSNGFPCDAAQFVMNCFMLGANSYSKFMIKNGHPNYVAELSMRRAIKYGHQGICKHLLGAGLDPNFSGGGSTLLFDAICHNQDGVVKILLKRGANVNLPYPNGVDEHPWMASLHENRFQYLESMLSLGADLYWKRFDGKSILEYCLVRDDPSKEGFTRLLDTLADRDFDPDGRIKKSAEEYARNSEMHELAIVIAETDKRHAERQALEIEGKTKPVNYQRPGNRI